MRERNKTSKRRKINLEEHASEEFLEKIRKVEEGMKKAKLPKKRIDLTGK